MIKEWKEDIIFEFDNGYRVRIPYVKSTNLAIPTKPVFDVLGPNDEYLTPNFTNKKYLKGVTADELITILSKIKDLEPNRQFDIL
jgi:hypothetical protein